MNLSGQMILADVKAERTELHISTTRVRVRWKRRWVRGESVAGEAVTPANVNRMNEAAVRTDSREASRKILMESLALAMSCFRSLAAHRPMQPLNTKMIPHPTPSVDALHSCSMSNPNRKISPKAIDISPSTIWKEAKPSVTSTERSLA